MLMIRVVTQFVLKKNLKIKNKTKHQKPSVSLTVSRPHLGHESIFCVHLCTLLNGLVLIRQLLVFEHIVLSSVCRYKLNKRTGRNVPVMINPHIEHLQKHSHRPFVKLLTGIFSLIQEGIYKANVNSYFFRVVSYNISICREHLLKYDSKCCMDHKQ